MGTLNAAQRELVLKQYRNLRTADPDSLDYRGAAEKLVIEARNQGRTLSKQDCETMLKMMPKVARAADEQEWLAFAERGELPAIKLSAQEMEASKGGGFVFVCILAAGLAVVISVAVADEIAED